MENGRLVELMSEMLDEMKGVNRRVDHLTDRVDHLTDRVDHLTNRVDEMALDIRSIREDVDTLKKGQSKTNITLHELRASVIQLAEGVNQIPDLDRRLARVEAVVFKQ